MKVLRKVAMAISAFLDVQMPGAQPHHDAWNVDYWQFLPGTKHRHWGTGRGPSSADVSLAGEAGPSPISSNLCASGHAIAQRPLWGLRHPSHPRLMVCIGTSYAHRATDQARRFASASSAAPTSNPITTFATDASGPKAPPLQRVSTPAAGRT